MFVSKWKCFIKPFIQPVNNTDFMDSNGCGLSKALWKVTFDIFIFCLALVGTTIYFRSVNPENVQSKIRNKKLEYSQPFMSGHL